MYEVFFNQYQLHFTTENNISLKDNIFQYVEIKRIDDFFSLLSSLESESAPSCFNLMCVISPGLLQRLPENFRQIPAAGGLVTDRKDRFLFIRRYGRWDLPKGAVEKGETAAMAAVREVEEECGIHQLEIRKELLPTWHLYRSPHIKAENNWVLKKTSWFEMYHQGDGVTTPQKEEDIEAVRWFSRNELDEVFESTYASLKKMLKAYFR